MIRFSATNHRKPPVCNDQRRAVGAESRHCLRQCTPFSRSRFDAASPIIKGDLAFG
jgi:hypothetical protein